MILPKTGFEIIMQLHHKIVKLFMYEYHWCFLYANIVVLFFLSYDSIELRGIKNGQYHAPPRLMARSYIFHNIPRNYADYAHDAWKLIEPDIFGILDHFYDFVEDSDFSEVIDKDIEA